MCTFPSFFVSVVSHFVKARHLFFCFFSHCIFYKKLRGNKGCVTPTKCSWQLCNTPHTLRQKHDNGWVPFLTVPGSSAPPPLSYAKNRGAGAPPNLTKKRSIKTQTRHTHGNTHNLYNERQLGREGERKSMEGRTRARGSAPPLISPGFVHTLAPGYVATIPTVPTVQLHRHGSEDDPRGDSVSA